MKPKRKKHSETAYAVIFHDMNPRKRRYNYLFITRKKAKLYAGKQPCRIARVTITEI